MHGQIKILVADRNALVVEALEDIFMEESGGTLVLTATSLEQTIQIAMREQPELIVIDAWMGSTGADNAVRQVLECSPASALFVMATRCDADFQERMRRAGAKGSCEKETMPEYARTILGAVRSAR